MLPLRCRCGSVRGILPDASPTTTLRLLCYCRDCQAFARFVHAQEPALDAQGGSDIVQTSQAMVQFTQGTQHLEAVRLTERGMIRIYASCCHTPVGNIMDTPHLSLLGMSTAFVDGDPTPAVGPPRAAVHPQHALGEPKPAFDLLAVLTVTVLSIRNLVLWRLRGDHLDSPFRREGSLILEPRVLTAAERSALG